MTAYATRAQFYRFAMPRGIATVQLREVASVDTSADTLRCDGHGLVDELPVILEAFDDDAVAPTGLSFGAVYYAKEVSGDDGRFQLSATAGGAAIDITGAGTGPFGVKESIDTIIDDELEFQSRRVDDRLKAHTTPMTAPYPVVITAAVCKLAAPAVARRVGLSIGTLDEEAARAVGDVERYARNAPVRDANASASYNTADSWGDDERGWTLDEGRVL